MDRRSFLRLGTSQATTTTTAAPPVVTTLTPYTGTFGITEARQLLSRATFGPSVTLINQAVEQGLAATMTQLFDIQEEQTLPVHFSFDSDPEAGIGESWVYTPTDNSIQGLQGNRRGSLRAWWTGLMLEGGINIREKMVLFWNNHFATTRINNPNFAYHYLDVLRRNALGSFRTMTEEMTIAPGMLQFLNGNENNVTAPNENYSRELLELFTIGRGLEAGPGDYTNYTEDDVIQMARALTGWVVRQNADGTVEGRFRPNRHDTGTKQLSYRFDNITIEDAGEDEYKNVIDIILQRQETARFICRQLHIWFVGPNIDPTVEANIIEPMAQLMFDNDYAIQPAVEALLSSEYFFQESHRGCVISNPLDFLFKIVGGFEAYGPENELLTRYRVWQRIANGANVLGLVMLDIPSVAGWPAYYQAPSYDQIWINSVTLLERQKAGDGLAAGSNIGGYRWEPDFLGFIDQIENNLDPNVLIETIGELLFPTAMSTTQRDFLKEVLIPGLPDYEWTIEYGDFLANPDDEDLRNGVLNKLRSMFSVIFKMPEFQLI